MLSTVYQIIRTVRPRQWLKNFTLFAAPLFFGNLFKDEVITASIQAFFIFCMISSATYIMNDIIDAPKDRLHPVKKNRPIASGKLSEKVAWAVAFVLMTSALYLGYTVLGSYFTVALLIYVILQLTYSLYLRNVIILDSLAVGSGFVLRVFAGGLATNTSLSSWLVLATIGLSLLLAFGKRRSERTLLKKHMKLIEEGATRQTLRHYPDSLLDSMISMSATFSIITYSLFTFQISPDIAAQPLKGILPSILSSPKWIMLTIPFVIYGVARYLYVIYEKEEGESPERVLLSDIPLLLSIVLWGLTVLAVIYLGPAL